MRGNKRCRIRYVVLKKYKKLKEEINQYEKQDQLKGHGLKIEARHKLNHWTHSNKSKNMATYFNTIHEDNT